MALTSPAPCAGAAPGAAGGVSMRTNVVAVSSALIVGPAAASRPRSVKAVDVDDARELADPLEEVAEVVIRPFELQADRPFHVHLLLRHGVRRESANCEVGLRRHRPARGAAGPPRPAPPAARSAGARAAPRGPRSAGGTPAAGARSPARGRSRCGSRPAARWRSARLACAGCAYQFQKTPAAASDSATNTPICPYHGILFKLRFIAMSAYRASTGPR